MTRPDPTDVAFSRGLLRILRQDMKKAKCKTPTNYWVYEHAKGHWEFQAPGFYWNGRASCAFEARYKGISAWLAKHDPEGYSRLEALDTRKSTH